MKILVLNQFGGGSGAPTGRLAAELVEFLRGRGHDARLLASDPSYQVRRRGWRRWAHEAKSHLILFFRALAQGKADAVIALTSPVCLPATAAVAAFLLRAKLYLWNMDLYPDLALVLRELKPGPLARMLRAVMARAYRSAAGVVALDEDMRAYLRTEYGVEAVILPPWPPELPWPDPASIPPRAEKIWLYSGNLGQAHDIRTLLEVQKRLEEEQVPAQLVLQGSGAQWLVSQEMAAELNLKKVVWREPVEEKDLTASLLGADVLVVTRKPEMKGLIWPSKLALALLSGRPLLWIGDTDSATSRALMENDRNGAFRADQQEEVVAWLTRRLEKPILTLITAIPTQASRRELMARWNSILESTCTDK